MSIQHQIIPPEVLEGAAEDFFVSALKKRLEDVAAKAVEEALQDIKSQLNVSFQAFATPYSGSHEVVVRIADQRS